MIESADLALRLELRTKAYASDPDQITADHIATAVSEAFEVAGENNTMAVLSDIAFYRYLLLIERNGVDEDQFKAYLHALKQIKDPTSPNAVTDARVKARENPYQ